MTQQLPYKSGQHRVKHTRCGLHVKHTFCKAHLVYLHSISWIDMHGLQHPARRVRSNGKCTQVKRPKLLSDLLECATIASVASKPEALGLAQDCPATPQGPVLVAPARPGAGVLHFKTHALKMLIRLRLTKVIQ